MLRWNTCPVFRNIAAADSVRHKILLTSSCIRKFRAHTCPVLDTVDGNSKNSWYVLYTVMHKVEKDNGTPSKVFGAGHGGYVRPSCVIMCGWGKGRGWKNKQRQVLVVGSFSALVMMVYSSMILWKEIHKNLHEERGSGLISRLESDIGFWRLESDICQVQLNGTE